MWVKINFAFTILLFFGFLVLSYRAGQSLKPNATYEAEYEKIADSINEARSVQEKISGSYFSYVPVYSHIYVSGGHMSELAVTLSMRNVDKSHPIQVAQVSYYNTGGKLIRRYLKEGYSLSPLETKEIFIKMTDLEGGSGANFLISFNSDSKALPPIFETVMTSKDHTFISRGVLYNEKTKL